MKKMKVMLVLVMVFVLSTALMAQGIVDKGVKAGLNLATLTGDDIEDIDSKIGFAVGGYVTYKLNDNLSLQPEIYFTTKGAKMEESYSEDDDGYSFEGEYEDTWKLSYIEIPVLARFDINSAGNLKPYLFAGPAIGLNIGATIESDFSVKAYDMDGELIYSESGSEEGDIEDIKAMDLGLVFGGGVMFDKISVDARFNMGLSSIDDSEEEFDVKNSVISLMVGYSF